MTCPHERKERCLFFGGAWRFVCLACGAVFDAEPYVPVWRTLVALSESVQAPHRGPIGGGPVS